MKKLFVTSEPKSWEFNTYRLTQHTWVHEIFRMCAENSFQIICIQYNAVAMFNAFFKEELLDAIKSTNFSIEIEGKDWEIEELITHAVLLKDGYGSVLEDEDIWSPVTSHLYWRTDIDVSWMNSEEIITYNRWYTQWWTAFSHAWNPRYKDRYSPIKWDFYYNEWFRAWYEDRKNRIAKKNRDKRKEFWYWYEKVNVKSQTDKVYKHISSNIQDIHTAFDNRIGSDYLVSTLVIELEIAWYRWQTWVCVGHVWIDDIMKKLSTDSMLQYLDDEWKKLRIQILNIRKKKRNRSMKKRR